MLNIVEESLGWNSGARAQETDAQQLAGSVEAKHPSRAANSLLLRSFLLSTGALAVSRRLENPGDRGGDRRNDGGRGSSDTRIRVQKAA